MKRNFVRIRSLTPFARNALARQCAEHAVFGWTGEDDCGGDYLGDARGGANGCLADVYV